MVCGIYFLFLSDRQRKRKNKKRKNTKSADDSETVTECPSPTEEIDDEGKILWHHNSVLN